MAIITADFRADFGKFYDALQQAKVQLKTFESDAGTVATSLTKMGNSFSGVRVIQQAHLMTAAMLEVGGMSKLTDKELTRLAATVAEASEKMKRMGQEVPPGFKKITDAAHEIKPATEGVSLSMGNLLSVAGKVAGALGLAFTADAVIRGLVNLTRSTIAYADTLSNLKLKTDLSYRDLQILEDVGQGVGISVTTMANAVQILQQRLGDRSAQKGIDALRLSFDQLLNLSPAEQFTTIGAALAKIEDPTLRATVGAQVFGRTWKEMLPLLRSNMNDAVKGAVLVGDAQIEAADRAGDRWTKFWNDQKRGWTAWAGDVILNWEKTQQASAEIQRQFNQGTPNLPGAPTQRIGAGPNINDVFDPTMISRLKVAGRTLDETAVAIEHSRNATSALNKILAESVGPLTQFERQLGLVRIEAGLLNEIEGRLITTGLGFKPTQIALPTVQGRAFGGNVGGPADITAAAAANMAATATSKLATMRTALSGVEEVLGGVQTKWAQMSVVAVRAVEGISSRLASGDWVGAIVAAGAAVGGFVSKLFGASEESKKVSPIRDEFFKMKGGLDALNPEVLRFTGSLQLVDNILKAKTVDQYNAALQKLNDTLAFQETAMRTLEDVTKKYGFTIEELGPAFQRQNLDKQAQALYSDYQVLLSGGIDVVKIHERMSEEVNAYIGNALTMGIEVPAAMKPMLELMAKQGVLTDAAGNKIDDLSASGITFAETMTQGFQKIVDAVTKLTEAITRNLGTAIQNIPQPQIVGHVSWNVDELPNINISNEGSTGGIVTPSGIQHFAGGGRVLRFRSHGSDTVPAMLTPGEMILNAGQQKAIRSLMGSGGGANAASVIDFAAMRDELRALRELLEAQAHRAPEQHAVAIRDALVQVGMGRRR